MLSLIIIIPPWTRYILYFLALMNTYWLLQTCIPLYITPPLLFFLNWFAMLHQIYSISEKRAILDLELRCRWAEFSLDSSIFIVGLQDAPEIQVRAYWVVVILKTNRYSVLEYKGKVIQPLACWLYFYFFFICKECKSFRSLRFKWSWIYPLEIRIKLFFFFTVMKYIFSFSIQASFAWIAFKGCAQWFPLLDER